MDLFSALEPPVACQGAAPGTGELEGRGGQLRVAVPDSRFQKRLPLISKKVFVYLRLKKEGKRR
jgi:hypothetical protein